MSTCKFFLQGTCKFGDNCKFSHQINDNTQFHGTSIMRSNGKSSTVDTSLLIKSVVNDMINAEKGGHWLLSSYAPFKDKPYFPGFENRSFEEIRYGYYEAMKNGTVEQYKQQLQIALQSAVMRMKALQNPTNEVIGIITQIYNSSVQSQNSTAMPFTQSNSIFGQNQSSSFNQNQAQPSIFAVANQKLFGNPPGQQQSMLGNSQMNTNSIFSGTPQQTNQNIFGGNQSMFNKQQPFANPPNSLFSNQKLETNLPLNANKPFREQNNTFMMQSNNFISPPSYSGNSMFNSQPKPFQSSSISPFSNQGQPANNSMFSNQNQPFSFANVPAANTSQSPLSGQNQQQSIFANTGQQNILQTSPSTQQQPMFTNTNQNIVPTSPMIQQQQQPKGNGNSIFSPPITQNSIFGGQASIFANQSENTVQKLTNSIFQQSNPQTSNVGASPDAEAYSKLEDLSESDIKSFQSECFEFGKIPEKPPTAQMCL